MWKRQEEDGLKWKEDAEWAALLDKCWDLNTARGVARKLADHYNNNEGVIKLADDGSEHQHRIALIIDKSIQGHVTNAMAEAFSKNDMEVRSKGVRLGSVNPFSQKLNAIYLAKH